MASLTPAQVDEFQREGYLVLDRFFIPEQDLDPVAHEYEGVLDALASDLLAKGQISSTYADR